MTDSQLIRRAEAAGVAPRYRDWRGRQVEVGGETLAAILDALDVPGGAADGWTGAADGWTGAAAAPEGSAPGGPDRTPRGPDRTLRAPDGRSWGFTVQLYSLRSRRSWGHGDLRDLAALAAWSGRDLGAGFVQVNPLHAAEPQPPVSPSPYLPMTRHYVSPLYLRIEDIPEYRRLPAGQRARIEALAAPLRARNASADLIDRDAVWTAKREALELIRRVPLSARRRADYLRFREREGRALQDWAAWCALAERHGPDWRTWPAWARDPRRARAAVAEPTPADEADEANTTDTTDTTAAPRRAAAGLSQRAEFHAWLQWLADGQLAAAQQAALAAGMGTGIITDLAVGAHPGGADAWANQGLLVSGLSAGAPPDEFNQRGQDWTQPPWHPGRLAEARYRPMAGLFGAALRHAGGLRVDHVMGLMRLWCVPAGMPPDRGAYIRYDHHAAVAALTGQAARAGALAIGEDLGTVAPWIRRYLAAHGVLGTTMLWFARERGGAPLAPRHWRRGCMATVGTHDVPPAAAFRTGEQVTIRADLGLLKNPEQTERMAAAKMLRQWQRALRRERLIPPGPLPGPDQFTVALYGYLARTRAALVGVSLADAVGDRRAQNIPGTRDEYPNWRVPLCDAGQQAVLLEDLPGLPLLQAVTASLAGLQQGT